MTLIQNILRTIKDAIIDISLRVLHAIVPHYVAPPSSSAFSCGVGNTVLSHVTAHEHITAVNFPHKEKINIPEQDVCTVCM